MPELPEVETIARQLRDRGIEGREILAVRIDWPRMVEPLKPKDFTQSICGTKIKKVGVLENGYTLSLILDSIG